MFYRKSFFFFVVFLTILTITACESASKGCPDGEIVYQNERTPFPADSSTFPAPETITINGKAMTFDQVVHGQLCNLTLRGKVYIACDVVVAEWKDTPNFLDGCDFVVEPGTVIYVAAHHNAPYYKGCASCHQSDGVETP